MALSHYSIITDLVLFHQTKLSIEHCGLDYNYL
jgi:hypothetical protein